MRNEVTIENKRDISISVLRANIVALFIGIPVAILQLTLFSRLHDTEKTEFTSGSVLLFFVLVGAGVVAHELIHGLTWVVLGGKSFSMVKFGVQWKTLTPYVHLQEPIEVNVYRIGGFMPGFVLGIIPYIRPCRFGAVVKEQYA
ncbi:MAG: DUF3267 domain-containing protein [Chloroflexota bacterium]|jgi:hypothetical protein